MKLEINDDQALTLATLLIKEAGSLRQIWKNDSSDRAQNFHREVNELESFAQLLFDKGNYKDFENYKEQILKVYSNS